MALLVSCPLVSAGCAEPYKNCFESTCCINGNFGCYKKPGKQYAQCRPKPDHGSCVDTVDWQCPGWEDCSENMHDCSHSKCCKDPNFGCFKRPTKQFAQCRPLKDDCVDTEDWKCPGWELCSGNLESCTNTHCCATDGYTCYKKHGAYSQCMKTGSCVKGKDGECTPPHVRAKEHACP